MDELYISGELYLLGQIVHESSPCSLPRTNGLPTPKAGFLMSPTGALLAAAREKQLYQLKQWEFLLNFSVVEEPILVTREPSKYSIFSWEDRLDSARRNLSRKSRQSCCSQGHMPLLLM